MNGTLRRALLGAALCLAVSPAARADTRSTAARVSDVRGALSVQGAMEEDASYGDVNTVLAEGDTLWTGENGRAEIETAADTWLRLADDTRLEVRRVSPDQSFRLWTGSVYVDAALSLAEPVHVDTPDGAVDVEPGSAARIDLGAAEGARVSAARGPVAVYPLQQPASTLRAGERVYLEDDGAAEAPVAFPSAAADPFDRYEAARLAYYQDHPRSAQLPAGVIGARDLDGDGTWVTIEGETYWKPAVTADWRPYADGYWSYLPAVGYAWVGKEPWGYTTKRVP